ncbi:MAG: hypothetical protein AAGE80_14315 [Pseudomonadota bacterium]
MTNFKNFIRDEAGAVTIDWVALTAGILLLAIALVYGIFNNGVEPLVERINSSLSTAGSGVNIGEAPDLNPAAGS